MAFCAHCGREVGSHGYCGNCGQQSREPSYVRLHDVGGDTAERPLPDPSGPPPLPEIVSNARFPLYADEVQVPAQAPPSEPMTETWTTAVPPDVDELEEIDVLDPAPRHVAPATPPNVWILVGAVMLVLALLGGWLAFRGLGDDRDPGNRGSDADSAPAGEHARIEGITASVPDTRPDGRDVNDNPVKFWSRNMFDGDRETAWQMPRDGSEEELTIKLPDEVTVTEVGLINGYAKKDGDTDWYPRNYRITEVTWIFDDGTEVPQSLEDGDRNVQTIAVDDVRTSTIRLRLDEVLTTGDRPNTAISEIEIAGVTSG